MSASLPRVAEWLQQRFPVEQEILVQAGSEPIPGHLNRWWWCIGGTPAYLFVVQIISGILLTFYYVPSPDHAYESVQTITTDIRFGWFIRSVHRWASHLMIIAVLLHMTRVFFTGAYRAPREGNWMVGCLILLTTLGMGFTGERAERLPAGTLSPVHRYSQFGPPFDSQPLHQTGQHRQLATPAFDHSRFTDELRDETLRLAR